MHFLGTIAPPFGTNTNKNNDDGSGGSAIPGLPDWIDLNVIVPVVATVVVICVGVVVICVAVTRRKQPILMPPGDFTPGWEVGDKFNLDMGKFKFTFSYDRGSILDMRLTQN